MRNMAYLQFLFNLWLRLGTEHTFCYSVLTANTDRFRDVQWPPIRCTGGLQQNNSNYHVPKKEEITDVTRDSLHVAILGKTHYL